MTQEEKEYEERLTLRMKKFSFFGKDVEQVQKKLSSIINDGHWIVFEMNQSTSLTNDLYLLDNMVRRKIPGGTINYHFEHEGNRNERQILVVVISPEGCQ